jgi:hypothetical protein
MADYAFNLTDLPDIAQTSVGSSDVASVLSKVKNALNMANARTVTHHVSQSWPSGTTFGSFDMDNGAIGTNQTACVWRLPVMGDGFGDYVIKVKCISDQATGPILNFTNRSGDLKSYTLVAGGVGQPAIGAVHTVTMPTMTVAAAADYYDELTFYYNCETGARTGQILSIDIYQEPQTSPLSAGLDERSAAAPHDTDEDNDLGLAAQPIGGDVLASGYSLNAALGKALIDTMNAVDQRPRAVQAWSARLDTNNAELGAQEDHEYINLPAHPVVRQAVKQQFFTVMVYAENTSATKEARIPIVCSDSASRFGQGLGRRTAIITIPANTAAAWYEDTIEVADEERLRSSTAHSCHVGTFAAEDFDGVDYAPTTDVRIFGYSFWGST